MTWSDVTIGGAFIVGAIVGGLATIRLTGHVLGYLGERVKR